MECTSDSSSGSPLAEFRFSALLTFYFISYLQPSYLSVYYGMPPFAYQRKTSQNKIVRMLRHRTISIVLLALVMVLLYFGFSAKGFYSRFVIQGDLHTQEMRVLELKRSISKLEHERDLLRDDRLKIEHVARETHGMIKKGEIVYRIRSAKEAVEK